MHYLIRAALVATLAAALGGCAVISVAGLAVTAGSLAVDAAVGTVKITGKAVGMAVDVVLPSGSPDK